MTSWKKVRGSQPTRPDAVEVGVTTVYQRRNIHQVTEEDAQGNDVTMWEYEERTFTNEEWPMYASVDNTTRVGTLEEENAETREALDSTRKVTEIAFVTMAESGSIDEVTAGEHKELFADWKAGVAYTVGKYRNYGSKLYRCVQDHTSQEGWEPDKAGNLWAVAADPAEEWPEWSQPMGAHDAYEEGAKVSHAGKHWVSDVNGNVWEPGTSGWTEAQE